MKTSESIKEIIPALLKAQKSFGTVTKDSFNPFFKSKYADFTAVINEVKAKLNDVGVLYMQCVDMVEGVTVVETSLYHTSGEFISTVTPVLCQKQNDPQAMGIGITYAKRYALQAILGLPTADDDGEGAMDRAKKPPKKEPVGRAAFDEMLGKINAPVSPETCFEWAKEQYARQEDCPYTSVDDLDLAICRKLLANVEKITDWNTKRKDK